MAKKKLSAPSTTETVPVVKKNQKKSEASAGPDLMSQCAIYCQQQEWRKAVVSFKQMCEKAAAENNGTMLQGLSSAQSKVEFSLRRQMAASLVDSVKNLLAKEYLLDVGE